MKRTAPLLAFFLIFMLTLPLLAGAKEDRKKPESSEEKISYALGVNLGGNFAAQGVAVNPEFLMQGIKDALADSPLLMTDEEIREAMLSLRQDMQEKHKARMEALAKQNLEESEAFFKENAKKPGIVSLPSGLQYQVVQEGTGKKPGKDDTVTVHYAGTLLNGQEFDSSIKRGEPATFKVDGVIPGWTEALQLMKEGGKMKLFIPPQLAYGEHGAGPIIGPNAALVFEVELIKVQQEKK
jgi:FKBP-type peptidyl-prolyl cis-trans isomerase FklB